MPKLLNTIYQPRDHDGDLHAEMMDIQIAAGELTRLHVLVEQGATIGISEAVAVYADVLCAETEDYYRKREQHEKMLSERPSRKITRVQDKPLVKKKKAIAALMLSHRYSQRLSSNKTESQIYGENNGTQAISQ